MVVDIVSDERAWAMFGAAALGATKDVKAAVELADALHEEWRSRFRGGDDDDEGDEQQAAPAAPTVTGSTRKAPNLLDEE